MSPFEPRRRREIDEHVRSVELSGRRIEYVMCRVIPDTVLFLREVVREADRLWKAHLDADRYRRIREDPSAARFLGGQVRLESVPPQREVLVFWLPLPPDFHRRVKAQLVDYFELPSEPSEIEPL